MYYMFSVVSFVLRKFVVHGSCPLFFSYFHVPCAVLNK
jgi:hypothetical protein